ncbi:hypothetical protein AALO_G00046470 [Alosa alosa]|uniref:Uncharacterized protein n=1 Tax=Alosa alosa TaxID=278164 RepID=A0AAV6HCW4_9TELE|nr:hypothetical protein AALO_G00046470 [Alosa alosa]
MGAVYTCCSWGYAMEEKNAILCHESFNYQELPAPSLNGDSRVSVSSGTIDLSQEFLPAPGADSNRPLWSTPRNSTPSNTEPESDGELQAFIKMRNQSDKASETLRLRSFNVCSKLLRMFYQSVVASVLFYAVVCWGGSTKKKDAG